MLAIVIPAYNRKDRLREALESLTTQIMKRFFVVVCDDCSTDDIRSVCDEFTDKLHVVYLRAAVNGGPGAARQLGLDWSIKHNMELIMFLDSDDLLFPNATQVLTHEINHARLDFLATDIAVEHRNEPQTLVNADEGITWFHGKIYRVAFLKQIGLNLPVELRTNEDLAFNLSAYWSSTRCSYIHTPVYLWRDECHSITRAPSELRINAMGEDYIRAIYWAFNFVKDNSSFDFSNLVPNLFSCYNYYQIVKARGRKIKPEIDQMISTMFEDARICKLLKKDKIWLKNRQLIWSYAVDDDKSILAFTETFDTWYRNHGGVYGV